jgi:glycosyltransferase involved in cell wall biosynthesis
MKVLIINQFPLIGGGSGFYTKNIAKSLRDLGHSVCIMIPENTTNIEEIEGIKIKPVFFRYKENIQNQLPFNFGCFTTHPRSNTTFNDYTNSQLEMYIKTFENAIENTIKEFRPDVIHSGHIWIISNIATKFNIPTIITSHGTDIIGYNAWEKFHKYAKEAVEKCAKIITISDSNNENVLKTFPNAKDKIVQIRNGYDQSVFHKDKYNKKEVLKEIGIEDNYKNIILFSGRLVQVKGVDILLKAAKIYEKEGILTIIAGEGILHNELEQLARKLNLKNVKFIGSKDQVTLNKLYNIADASILSSRYEGFPLVVIESLACGTPVVCTDIDSMKTFMNDKFGIMVEKENSEALAKGIIDILDKKEKYNSDEISEYIKNNYSQNLLINKVIETYESCLK